MQVSVEKTSELSRKMTVSVPEEVVREKIAARLKSLAREVRIDGFRPGKAPQHVINKMYGDRVRDEITGDLIQSTYFEALQNQNLNPAGYPHIDTLDSSDGFKYTAVFEIYPEIPLNNIQGIAISRPVAVVEETDVDAMIEKLRQHKKTWTETQRPSREGDRVTLNFSGKADDENFTNGRVENYLVQIGGKEMIPGFEDNLIDLEPGAQKTFTTTFPEDYGNAKLAGKTAEFDVEIVKIEEPTLPEIDAEFVKGYGIDDGSAESFREDVKGNMERELELALRGHFKNAVMDALYANIQIALPNTLVDEEIESLTKPYIETAKRQKLKPEDLKLPREMFEERAKRRVALGLILSEIIKENNIKLDDSKVRSTIEDMAQSYERPEDVINWYYADKSRLNDIKQMVLEDQTLDWVVAQGVVTDVPSTFTAIMDQQQQQQG